MKRTLILVAGYPGTGKTYLMNEISKYIKGLHTISPDTIKERSWDHYGFDTLEQKESLIQLSWKEYYLEVEEWMKRKCNIISDYPFSEKQRQAFIQLTKQYHYQMITIRLSADLHILFERQKSRDLSKERHLGHIMRKYHKGIKIKSHKEADHLLTKEDFFNRCAHRGYESFSLGKLYEVDVSDFSKVDYKKLIESIQRDITE